MPARVVVEDLRVACARVAACALVARRWPGAGSRHDFALALAGVLLRGGIEVEAAARLVETAARIAGDGEAADRARAVRDTARALEAGEAATGGPTLARLLSDADRVLDCLRRWLGLRTTGGGADEEPWSAPVPLAGEPAPPFPVETLPGWLRGHVVGVAEALQVPPDLLALLDFAVLAASVARKVAVRVRDGWVEPLNLFTVAVLPPGEGKSPAFAEATRPLDAWEAERAARLRDVTAEARMTHDILAARAKKLRDRAAAADPEARRALEDEARGAALALEAHAVPVLPRLIVDDVTPERLGAMLAEQGGRLAVMSPEGGVFELLAGRYTANGAPNLDVFLKSHPGDTLRVDRGTRPPDYVRKPALTVALAVQPDVLHRLAAVPEFRGRRLLARFSYTVPPSRIGHRDPEAPPVPSTVLAEYARRIQALLDTPAPPEADGEPAPRLLSLSPAALSRFQAFRRRLEPRLMAPGDLAALADWGGKLPGTLARLAGLLHVADAGADSAAWNLPIPDTTMARAETLAEYLIAHARVAFRVMGQDPAFGGAKRVLAWLRERRPPSLKRRDLHRALAGTFQRVADLAPALDLLAEYGYLRDVTPPTPGRRPSLTYAVNPRLYDNLDNPDSSTPPDPQDDTGVEVVKVVPSPAAVSAGDWDEV